MGNKNNFMKVTVIRGEEPISTTNANNSTSKNKFVASCKKLINEKKLTVERAASIITGEIRTFFIRNLQKNGEGIDIESIRYLDEILFNDMRYLIFSSLSFTSNYEVKEMIMHLINNVCSYLEYSIDEDTIDLIKQIIDEV